MAEQRLIGRWFRQGELEGRRKSIIAGPGDAAIVIRNGEYGEPHTEAKVYTKPPIPNPFSSDDIEVLLADLNPFNITYELWGSDDSGTPIVRIRNPVLSKDDKLVTGHVTLSLEVDAERPGLLFRLRQGQQSITAEDIAMVIRDVFLAHVITAEVAEINSADLRGTTGVLKALWTATQLQLEEFLKAYGLKLTNFAPALLPADIRPQDVTSPAFVKPPIPPDVPPVPVQRPPRWRFLVYTIVVIAIAIFVGSMILSDDEPENSTAVLDENIHVSMASSITKWEWLEAAAEAFNLKSQSDPDYQIAGKSVQIDILLEKDPLSGRERHWNSPTQVSATLNGDIEPTVLSPASSTWIAKLNKDWSTSDAGRAHGADTNEALVRGISPSLLSTPIVIAMWQSRAEALGCWPVSQPHCTWERIRDLAIDPIGWGAVGRDDWKSFHFGYAYVGESDVGTQTAVLVCMMGIQKTKGLTVDDVSTTNECGSAIADIESSIVHRGTSSPLILDAMLSGGPAFLDAVTTYEKNVIGFNLQHPDSPWGPLVSIYPQDGTVIADHTFAILDNAPWVSESQIAGAELFRNFLFAPEQQGLLLGYGIRPNDPSVELGSPIDTATGASATANLNALDVPEVLVVDQVTEVWRKLKKPANVCLVFDKSGSMQGEKIREALTGAGQFVAEMDSSDWLCWQPFDSEVYPITEGHNSDIGEDLRAVIGDTTAKGQTALYDAITSAFLTVQGRRDAQGDSGRYGIVVLSDGEDNGSISTLGELEKLLTPLESDISGIQVHIIGVGDDADDQVLSKIAGFTNGGHYWKVKDPSTIEAVYRRISKYW